MPEPTDVKCPSCAQKLAAVDESGLVNALQEHPHEEHALAVSRERVRENGTYKKTSRWTYRDPKDWIGVPVPDAGVPGETVERARAAVQSNVRTSRAAGREWELSGGVARCASCGSTMRTRTRARDNGGEPLAYYVCSRAHQGGGCDATRNHAARVGVHPRRYVVREPEEPRLADGPHLVPLRDLQAPAGESLDGPPNGREQAPGGNGVGSGGAGRVRRWAVHLVQSRIIVDLRVRRWFGAEKPAASRYKIPP